MTGISDYSYLFSNATSSSTDITSLLSDYAAIKNGSYGKLMKAYYTQQEEATVSGDSEQSLTLMKSGAAALKESADALSDDSIWEKKVIQNTEETGEVTESEDYDWDAIINTVETFVEDYNSVVEQAGESNTKAVLRNAAWMTSMTAANEDLLSQVGITVGSDNKLEVDTEVLKKANVNTLKTLFQGYGSFADKVAQKAGSIGNAVTLGVTYTSSGAYADTLSELISSTIDEEI